MKKTTSSLIKSLLISSAISVTACTTLTGCQQTMVKSFGGDMVVELEPGEKLELITWKNDDSLWHLTRPMREDETAETHEYKQSTNFGVFEGSITIKEINKEDQ